MLGVLRRRLLTFSVPVLIFLVVLGYWALWLYMMPGATKALLFLDRAELEKRVTFGAWQNVEGAAGAYQVRYGMEEWDLLTLHVTQRSDREYEAWPAFESIEARAKWPKVIGSIALSLVI